MDNMMDMYEESFKRFAEGEVVTGRIISVDKDYVLVDIGYKSEGQIKIQEFQDEDGNLIAKDGDLVDVMVEWWDDEEERVVLSKEKAAKVKVWEAIKKSFDEDQTVKGVIVNRVKGGFSVDIGVQAFLPGSQADLRPIRNLDEMVGKTFTFKI
ncbi:MAG: S1 RNA-binding domain-containing protein, partial [Proteobacteria bacterium]|nr:S1 RNA-binding domain-containing protein [Pseudomonadota bacterium]